MQQEKKLKSLFMDILKIKRQIEPIIKYFPKWNIKEADRLWCAEFVYYCCMEAGQECLSIQSMTI